VLQSAPLGGTGEAQPAHVLLTEFSGDGIDPAWGSDGITG